MFPELGSYHFPTKCSLYDFDDIYTAPRHGFGTAEKYYAESSSGQFLKAIEIPGLILAAQDDPIVSYESCPEMGAKTKLVLSRYGGHCGFVGKPNHSFFWLDDYLFRWLEEHSQG